ncbi:DUF2752 domain-containing protein [Mariniflexile ostreae]|uniref:DUF2752 domain-containing protein n=1 Tax=Mariniflexile ostreae TaxID=1520892 RepID=UPI0036D3729A
MLATAISGVLVWLYLHYNPAERAFFPQCPVYAFTGYYCSGCGSQRAMHQFLNGHIIEGLKHNLLIVLLAVVIVYHVMIKLSQFLFKKNVTNLLHQSKTIYIILFIVIAYSILRNIKSYPFTILAP